MTKRAVFFDRDGTLIEHYDLLSKADQVQLLGHTVPALKLLKQHEFILVMVTNQPAVGEGMITEKTLVQIHDHLKEILGRQGAYLDGIYYCPYHPEAPLEKYRQDSKLRKPKPGMLYQAAEELDIDMSQSWLVGGDDNDMEAGAAAGCRTIMLEPRGGGLVRKGRSRPDFFAVNLQEAANLIIRYSERIAPPKEKVCENETVAKTVSIEEAGEKESSPSATEIPADVQPVQNSSFEELPVKIEIAEKDIDFTIEQQLDTPVEVMTQVSTQSIEALQEDVSESTQQEDKEEKAQKAKKTDTETLLAQILRELKALNRDKSMPVEFSTFKLLAGVVQMLVVLCLVLAFWLGTGPEGRADAAQSCLLLALIFQVLTLTLLLVNR